MFVLGETTLIFIFSSEAVSVSESENGHDAFFRTVEDAAMPVWERLFWHSSQCGWDGFGDARLPRKEKRDFFLSPVSLGCHQGGGALSPVGAVSCSP